MPACNTYTAAFGYQLFISPLSACVLDVAQVTGGIGAGGFIDPSAALPAATQIDEGATPAEILSGDPGVNIVFDGDTVTTESVFQVRGLMNAAIETDTGTENILIYEEEAQGFDTPVATSKSWTMTVEGVSRFDDAGYKIIRLAEQSSVSGKLKLKVGRIGPSGSTEGHYGFATVANFSESNESGSVVKWSCELQGYGPLALDIDNSDTINLVGEITSLQEISPGVDLADATYTDQPLTGGSGNGLATADFVVSGGVVTDFTLTNGGDGYQPNDVLGVDLPGADIVGVIDDPLTISDAGTDLAFYENAVRFTTGGTGSGATISINADGGVLTSATVDGGGSGYTVGDVLTITGIIGALNPDFGAVQTFANLQGGANYADGTFAGVSLTGGSGSGLTADVTVSGGSVVVVNITDGGDSYTVGDTLTATLAPAVIPGTGEILTLDAGSLIGGGGYADATYSGVALTGGSGTLATADITVSGGVVTAVTLVNGGQDYVAGDSLSADDADLGGLGGAGFSIDVATVDEDTDAVVTAWSVDVATVDENERLTPVLPTVTVAAVTTTPDGPHTDASYRVVSIADNPD